MNTFTSEGWLERSAAFGEAIRGYHRSIGNDPQMPAVRSTVRTNTELVPKRGDGLLRLLRDLADLPDLRGCRVLDVGCGFGAIASYVAWMGQPDHMLATDIRADQVEAAKACVEPMGLEDRLSFAVADMEDLSGTGRDGAFDLVICNNAFIFLSARGAMDRALREFARVTAPGGHVFFYQPNLLRLREPFTKDPIVHLLPKPLADGLGKVTGWRNSHDRARYLSPPGHALRVRRAGFEGVRHRPWAGRDYRYRWVSEYYALAARRSEG
jgi:2-polyprenyl-3-methyl-5-hydroxy-6-metoxy-1,4-benzoquinol methylase